MTDSQPSPPGQVLAEMMKERGWTQLDLAAILDKPQRSISEIITGKKAITPDTARSLARAFGNDPEFWVRLEGQYRLSLAKAADPAIEQRACLYDLAPVKDMEKRGWIKKTNTPATLADELRRFFGVEDLSRSPELSANTKKTQRTMPLTLEQRAWCIRARNLAGPLKVERFTEARFERGLTELRQLAAWPNETRRVPRVLASMGIRFVVIEPLPRTRIDGAAMWLSDRSPIIALSVRYDRIDSFWHSLGHELSHVRHHDGLAVDTDLVGEKRRSPAELDATERRADSEAIDFIISNHALDDFIVRVSPLYSRSRINQFANSIRIHPGIIVGQLQYRGELGYSQLRNTLVRVREFVTSEALTDGWGHTLAC